MELATQILKFIENPFPLWDTTLTHQLVVNKWSELDKMGFKSFDDYSTERFWFRDSGLETGNKKVVAEGTLSVEMPSFRLKSFYDEHGLEVLTNDEIEAGGVLLKLKDAISIFHLVKPAYNCITDLVRSIHILRQPGIEIDVSYSHPEIPFSIFLSVCDEDSIVTNLRVAESILHEAMHLKLTLIENIIPLIKPGTNGLYYSPWRDEQRPIQGVLHGLFVFTAIEGFYEKLYSANKLRNAENYFSKRVNHIKDEIKLLIDFPVSLGLTEAGASLAASLLPSN